MAGAIVLHYTDHPARPTHDVPGCRYFFEEGRVVFSIHLSQNFGQYLGKTCSGTKLRVKPNPPNGSPDNGSIQIMVRVWARPILKCHCRENCSDNGSIGVLVQFSLDKTAEP